MAGDAYYESVKLLLHCDGSDGSTTFTDSSLSAHTVTAAGNAHIETDQYKFGTASGAFDGTGDYLSTSANADYQFGTGDFTVEAWVRFSGWPNNNLGFYFESIVGTNSQATETGWMLQVEGTASSLTSLSFRNDATNYSGSYSFSLNTWYHLAAVRSSGQLYLFVDGTQVNTTATFTSNITAANTLYVGTRSNHQYYPFFMVGFIDDIRITKGVARYTSNFTAPTAAFPNIAGQIAGTVLDDAGDPVARVVRAYRRDTGALVGNTTSDAGDGSYSMDFTSTAECTVICLDDAGGDDYNDLLLRVTPA